MGLRPALSALLIVVASSLAAGPESRGASSRQPPLSYFSSMEARPIGPERPLHFRYHIICAEACAGTSSLHVGEETPDRRSRRWLRRLDYGPTHFWVARVDGWSRTLAPTYRGRQRQLVTDAVAHGDILCFVIRTTARGRSGRHSRDNRVDVVGLHDALDGAPPTGYCESFLLPHR